MSLQQVQHTRNCLLIPQSRRKFDKHQKYFCGTCLVRKPIDQRNRHRMSFMEIYRISSNPKAMMMEKSSPTARLFTLTALTTRFRVKVQAMVKVSCCSKLVRPLMYLRVGEAHHGKAAHLENGIGNSSSSFLIIHNSRLLVKAKRRGSRMVAARLRARLTQPITGFC